MNTKTVILGAGESGVGAALLAVAKGLDVFVSDGGAIQDRFKDELVNAGISYEAGHHSMERILEADLIVRSPGIPDSAAVVKAIKKKGIELISEIEFAFRHTSAKIVAITGSNGKTTTTLLTYHLMKEAGLDVAMAGNVGQSFARKLAESDHEWFVLEVSSFQLDDVKEFRAEVAIITNITPDHLDRYGYDFSRYAAAKFRIVLNATESDYLIYDADDLTIREIMKAGAINAMTAGFSVEKNDKTAFADDEKMYFTLESGDFTIPLSDLPLQGKHNARNAMAAVSAALLAGVKRSQIIEALPKFRNAPHRMEKVGEIYGVTYINDSKATNVDSVFYALESMKRPVIWIAGGVDKGNDYSQITALVKEKVKAIICLGTDNSKLISGFGELKPRCAESGSMADAVKKAAALAQHGDVVLLSPACASFDLFKNYEDRGDQFRDAVIALEQRNQKTQQSW